jgi:hypothetical protein
MPPCNVVHRPLGAHPIRPRVSPPEPVASLAPFLETRAAMRRQAHVGAMGRRPRNLCVPDAEGPGVPEGNKNPRRGSVGRGGVVSGGVFDHGTHDEDGPVTWEALASPRRIPVRRRVGDPSPTHDPSAGTRVVGPRGTDQASASREATARGTEAGADGGRESEGGIRAVTSGNGLARWTRPSTGGPWCGAREEGPMTDALTVEAMSPGRFTGGERAQRDPEGRLNALAHLIDGPALARASHRQRADAAVGVDGGTTDA